MALTDVQIRQVKAQAKPYKLFDGGYLAVRYPQTGKSDRDHQPPDPEQAENSKLKWSKVG